MHLRNSLVVVAIAAITAVAQVPAALAQNSPPTDTESGNGGGYGSGQGGHHHSPSPQAFAACEGKKAGDAVTITRHGGRTMPATCTLVDGRLAARPEHHGHWHHDEGQPQ